MGEFKEDGVIVVQELTEETLAEPLNRVIWMVLLCDDMGGLSAAFS